MDGKKEAPRVYAGSERGLKRVLFRVLCRQNADLDIAIPDVVPVVLQIDPAGFSRAVIAHRFELALLDQRFPLVAAPFILDDFLAVEPVLDVITVDKDAALVPLADRLRQGMCRGVERVTRSRAGQRVLPVRM